MLIDVDDEHEDEVSIFGLREVWRALSDVMTTCWVEKRRDGRGYPAGHTAWVRFIQGWTMGSEVLAVEMLRLGNGTMSHGGRRVSVLDLSEG